VERPAQCQADGVKPVHNADPGAASLLLCFLALFWSSPALWRLMHQVEGYKSAGALALTPPLHLGGGREGEAFLRGVESTWRSLAAGGGMCGSMPCTGVYAKTCMQRVLLQGQVDIVSRTKVLGVSEMEGGCRWGLPLLCFTYASLMQRMVEKKVVIPNSCPRLCMATVHDGACSMSSNSSMAPCSQSWLAMRGGGGGAKGAASC
jgi:hypothetical protein